MQIKIYQSEFCIEIKTKLSEVLKTRFTQNKMKTLYSMSVHWR